MLRWLGPRKAHQPISCPADPRTEEITDDPLAAIDTPQTGQTLIYSVSRSVFLPRVSLKNTNTATFCTGTRINPLFQDVPKQALPKAERRSHSAEKSSSSGYGSTMDPMYADAKDVVNILEQNPHFVKSIKVSRAVKNKSSSGSSGGGTLSTIPEGRVDIPIPKPIWPGPEEKKHGYDSLVDDALLLYTSLNPQGRLQLPDNQNEASIRDVLMELFNSINASTEHTPEEVLKKVNEKISSIIQLLRLSTEEEMRKLCVNLSNCSKLNSVLRAVNSSSSSETSPTWSERIRTPLSETDDLYQLASTSSSSSSSDSAHPVFVHDDLGSVPNGMRNALIYGTYRTKCAIPNNSASRSLKAINDNKPSVWQQYYGVRAGVENAAASGRPTDIPIFPGGRPEADFTLDVPRSELLSKRMKQDKKWRCRCRLLTSFLGLVFFLLTVMAVSLMLTRGKRMFGSMM